MKICFVIDSLGTGGAERSTADLWYFLRAKGIELQIVALGRRTEGIQEEILNANFDVHFLAAGNIVKQTIELHRIIRRGKPDLVHSILFKSNLRTRLVRLFLKFDLIESLVNCQYDKIRLRDPRVGRLAFYYYKMIDGFTIGLVDQFVAITDSVKSHYQLELGIDPVKIKVIKRGRTINRYLKERDQLRNELLSTLNVPPNCLIVTHVGRQEYQKGHLVFLKALSKLEPNESQKIIFLFAGREGNSSSDVKTFIQENALSHQVFWLGHRYDVEKILAASDIFVFPSLYEGLGGVLIEAQAAGLPIICSDIPVFNEVVVENNNALMFHNNDPEDLRGKLKLLLEDGSMRQQFGKNSLDNFMSQFLLERINNELYSLYLNFENEDHSGHSEASV